VAGRALLILRLLVRDLRQRRTETVLLLLAIAAATGTLTLGLALNGVAARPYQQTRAATAGPDEVAEPLEVTGSAALAALAPLTTAPGVVAHSGPYPVAYLLMSAHGKTVQTVVEGRDAAPAAIDRPAVTSGTWVRSGGVVVERAFADVLGLRTGDTVSIDGHPLRVVGTAVTAARAAYPRAGWRVRGTPFTDPGGLVWVDRGDIAALAGGQQSLSYTLNVKLADPTDGDAFGSASKAALHVTSWQFIADQDNALAKKARKVMLIGSWLLAALALASVAGIVAGRLIGRRRRLGLLKAVGAGPAMVAAVHLAEYLVIGLVAAGLGLAAGWLAGPLLTSPGAGFLGSVGIHPPPPRTVVAAVALALVIAVAATLAPVVRAATSDTVHALADAASPPRRRGWRVWLSRRVPTALMLGVRVNARRPRRARLATVNTLIITTTLAAAAMGQAQNRMETYIGPSELPNPADERSYRAILIVTVVLCVLALINAAVNTWTAVLDARHPLAVARALGATPGQAAAGLAVAQLLPAIPGVVLGIPAGIVLFLGASNGEIRYPPGSWWLAIAAGVLLAIAVLTAVPAAAAARRPVADALKSPAA
jgi:putative ABC transport system permease protein